MDFSQGYDPFLSSIGFEESLSHLHYYNVFGSYSSFVSLFVGNLVVEEGRKILKKKKKRIEPYSKSFLLPLPPIIKVL